MTVLFFFSSRRRHTRFKCDWSSDVCSSDLLVVALAAGLPVAQIVGTAQKSSTSLLETGFGGILGHIALIIGLGTLIGAILESSGGAEVLTGRLLRLFGENRAPLAMGLSGLIFGIPVFFDV